MQTIKKLTAALLAAASLLAISPAANAGLIALYTYDNAANLGLDTSGKGNKLLNSGSVAAASGTLAGLPTGDSSRRGSTRRHRARAASSA
jgi:hypothetical protein